MMQIQAEPGHRTVPASFSNRKLRVVIVGAGYVAKHHIAALRRLSFVEIIAVCDVNQQAAAQVAAANSISHACDSLEEALRLEPNVVYVLTPPATHAAIALQAIRAKCHVFVEKPMAESVEECDSMISAAQEERVMLSVNHSDRFDPVVLRALSLCASGKIGDILSVDVLRGSEYPAYGGGELTGPFKQGSYPFRDLGVHALYTFDAFLGNVQKLAVQFRSTKRDSNLRFDEWTAEAICERGAGRALLSWNSRPMENRLVVRGTHGVIEADRFLQICRQYRVLPGPKFVGILLEGWRNAVLDVFRIPWAVLRFALGTLKSSPGIQASAAAFATAVYEGSPPPVSAEEGRRTVALLESAGESADFQRRTELAERFRALPAADALVTGANGFLGRALVGALRAKGQLIRVLVRRPYAEWMADPQIQMVVGNLGEPSIVNHAVENVRIVYHVGATMKGGEKDFEAGTTWGTRNVIAACQRHQTRRLVYVSSMGIYDHAGRKRDQLQTEQAPLEPHPDKRGAYTRTKLAAEQLVREAIEQDRLPAVIIRPGQIFGPGAERIAPNGVISWGSRWLAVGSGRQTLPLVYRDDVVDALLRAAEAPDATGKVFNVSDPSPCTQQQYLEHCRQFHGEKLTVLRVPTVILLPVAWAVEMLGKALRKELPLSRYKVRSLRPLANVDSTAAKQVLGWEPHVGVGRGLRLTFGDLRTAKVPNNPSKSAVAAQPGTEGNPSGAI